MEVGHRDRVGRSDRLEEDHRKGMEVWDQVGDELGEEAGVRYDVGVRY